MHFNKDKAREIIMKHYMKPQNKKDLTPNQKNTIYSNSCADKLIYELTWDNDVLVDAKFSGNGCAPFVASTDLFFEKIKGKTKDEIISFINIFTDFVKGNDVSEYEISLLGDLWVFYNIKIQPNRIICTLLPTNVFINE
ncbi:iron-sulfur cluster assembly scaffold protein [Mycoplasmopsis felis]|uniref:iron-sulfur cluster assembly scaffold protein n=1 Tax=Mycoplasmopsis felis TaxID=33923 RepID=UPI002AFEAE8E|nr:iron-sulfur cluster assembly scaffold protein [Mycoplasmopsis felis]WQQ04079.1 iron-sulfur cluster assembly scaffold protein [Mycoplasmopsis felis]